MTRLFREGRTETVRSCTMESCAFVRSMIRDETVRVTLSTRSTTSHSLTLRASRLPSDRRAPDVAEKGSRKAPKHVPPGDDGRRHRPSPLLSLCGLQIPGGRVGLPQGGTEGRRRHAALCWLLVSNTQKKTVFF